MFTKTKHAVEYTMFAIVAIQAARGWYGLTRELLIAAKEAHARRKK